MRLIYLSDDFYNAYRECPEILTKKTRPYACLSVLIDGIPFAIPFRHHITHKWAYLTYGVCGLDYTKAVVVRERRYISPEKPTIEQQEFNALKGKEPNIASGMKRYLAAYRKAALYPNNPHYSFIRNCSTLQYFHKEIGI